MIMSCTKDETTTSAISLVEVDRFTTEDLNKLASGKIPALCVKNFYPQKSLQKYINVVNDHPIKAGYGVDAQLVRTGTPFYDTTGNPHLREEYLNFSMDRMKDEFQRFNYHAPMYAFFLTLMTIYLSGIQFENLDGKSMWAGCARLFDRVGCLPHCDNLSFDAPEFERASELKRQLAVNVYAQVPEQGAEIDIWDLRFANAAEYNARCIPGSYGIDPQQLPPPSITISPKAGDLILFDSNYIHAARPSNGLSISHSCFMGFRSFDLPLTVWS